MLVPTMSVHLLRRFLLYSVLKNLAVESAFVGTTYFLLYILDLITLAQIGLLIRYLSLYLLFFNKLDYKSKY
jgi:hypothetical protein